MPTPVSVTLNSTASVPSTVHSRMSTVIVPSCVNLLALLSRLSRIWRVLVRSACIGRHLVGAAHRQRVPVLLDQRPDGVHQPADHGLDVERLEREHHLAGFDLREIQDAVDQVEQMLAGATGSASGRQSTPVCPSSSAVSCSSSLYRMMAFSGVRSSWLMLARNSLLARVAFSARCCVTRSSLDQRRQPLGVLPLRVVSGLEHVRVAGQLALDSLALGDVAHVGGKHLGAVSGDRRDRDLDGKRLAALADGRELEPPVQDGRVPGGEIAGQRLAQRLAPVGGKIDSTRSAPTASAAL